MDWMSIAGAAGGVFGKGASLSHEQRKTPDWLDYVAPGMGGRGSPVMDEFGNFYTIQDNYEDSRQVQQQGRLNQLSLDLERRSFNQKLGLAKEHGLHPLSVLGVPMGGTTVGASVHESSSPVSLPGGGDVGRHNAELSDSEKRMMEYNERIASANARDAEASAARNELQLMRESSVAVGRPGSLSNDVQIKRQSALSGVPASRISYGGGTHGTNDGALISIEADKVTASSPDNPGLTAGVKPSLMRVMGDDGRSFKVADPSVLQTEIDEGALYNSLINHGFSPTTALDIVAYKDFVVSGLAGVAGGLAFGGRVAVRAWQAKKAAEAAARAKAHRRWKGGE